MSQWEGQCSQLGSLSPVLPSLLGGWPEKGGYTQKVSFGGFSGSTVSSVLFGASSSLLGAPNIQKSPTFSLNGLG